LKSNKKEGLILSDLNVYEILQKKRDGKSLDKDEITFIINGYTTGTIPDYQMSAFLMATFLSKMNKKETAYLTEAMLYSGETLSIAPKGVVDKHSTGGVGDKTSFIIAPIAAAAGVLVPMISGRGLGHTGGTLDKLDSIKGINTTINSAPFIKQIKEVGCVFGGQTKKIAPADKKIYALRDVTATVESIPLITASIMSKKLAEGINGLVLDIKTGNGAFMAKKSQAIELGESLKNTALNFGKDGYIFLTDMSQPLGNAVGHSIELIECIEVLKGKGPSDLIEICLDLSAAMIHLGGQAKSFEQARELAKDLVQSGAALNKFIETIEYQGGDSSFVTNYKLLPTAEKKLTIKASKSGYISEMNNKKIGLACIEIGGGRRIKTDKINLGSGFYFHKKIGDKVEEGEKIVTIHYDSKYTDALPKLKHLFKEELIDIQSSSKKVKNNPLIYKKSSFWSKK
jgi:pyrimidine-nucleoside phosphorylase